jgi:23S rRNA pseudouridine1911/1915/1917 synthase
MKERRQVFHVREKQAEQTLAAALRKWMPGTSWSQVQSLIRTRRILLSGNICQDPSRRLRIGDVVKILYQPAAKPAEQSDIRIEFLDEYVCVVLKPPGINATRHEDERFARRRQFQPSLAELLPRIVRKVDPRLRHQSGRMPPIFPVHRLDRETGGLMVFARTRAAERHLSQQFRNHSVRRRYLAIAQGDVAEQTIDTRLVRDRGDGRRGSTADANAGRRAVTHIRPIEYLDKYTVIECRLETGRTHQIRIHLSELGCPLCGEKVYNRPLFGKPWPDTSGAPRLALHAAELGFLHPATGEMMRFQSSWPPDLARFLKQLRQEKRKGRKGPKESDD